MNDCLPGPTAALRHPFGTGLILAGLMLLLLAEDPAPYPTAHWYFTYSDGLASRAAVGSTLQAVGGTPSRHLQLAASGLYMIAAIALVWGVHRLGAGRSRLGQLIGMTLVFGLVLPHLASELGRFDAILIILAVSTATVATTERRGRHAFAALLLTASVAVHEAALVLTVPWIACWIADVESNRGTRRGIAIGAVIAVPACITAGLMVAHTPASDPVELAARLFPASFPDDMAITAASVHFSSLEDNVADTLHRLREPWVAAWLLWYGLVPLASMMAVAVAAVRFASIRWRDLLSTERLMLTAAVSPLLLVPIAHDWHRWTMFSGLLIGVTTLIVLSRRPTPHPSPRLWAGALLATVVGIAIPGLG